MSGFIQRVTIESLLNNMRGCTQRVFVVNGGQIDEMPEPSAAYLGNIIQYIGETTADYTRAYFYECVGSTVASSASASQTVGSGLTDITVDKETLEQFTGWTTDNSLQIFYTPDGWSVDTASLGVSYTGTPVEGDAITIVYTAPVTTYAWQQIDVQPGGGDTTRVIIKSNIIPTAGADNVGQMYIYAGETGATYTHGYIYECQKTSITYTGTVSFEAATLSGTTVACSGDDFANFLTEAGADPTPIVSGTRTYAAGAGGWRLVGKDAEDNTITSFLEYGQDYVDAGFTFTGTPQDGDVVAFTCTVAEDTVTYGWVRLNTQPVPTPAEIGAVTQETHTITLVSTDWSSHTQTKTVSGVTADNTVIVAPASSSAADYAAAEILCTAQAANSLTFTCTTDPTNNVSVNIVILN